MTPYLAVGAWPHPENVPELEHAGIRGILNVVSHAPRRALAYVAHVPESIEWALCGFWDGFMGRGEPGSDEHLTPEFARFVVIRAAEMLRDHQPLLVHCMGGRGRSGNVAAILYAAREGIDVDAAIARMQRIRPALSAFQHHRFWKQVRAPDLVELAGKVLATPDMSREDRNRWIRGEDDEEFVAGVKGF